MEHYTVVIRTFLLKEKFTIKTLKMTIYTFKTSSIWAKNWLKK